MALTRKTALAIAGTVTGTITAASVAGAVNLGLLSSAPAADPSFTPSSIEADDPIDPTTTTVLADPGTTIVYEDVYDLAPVGQPSATGSDRSDDSGDAPDDSDGRVDDDDDSSVAPTTTVAGSTTTVTYDDHGGDDDSDDDLYEDEDHEDEDHEDESRGDFDDD